MMSDENIFSEISVLYQNIQRQISEDIIFKCLNITAVSLGRFITCYVQNVSIIFHFNDIYCQKRIDSSVQNVTSYNNFQLIILRCK
jgi:hypothetical protein